MDKKSIRIQVAVDLAQRAEDSAAQQLMDARNLVVAERLKRDEIQTYYINYKTMFSVQTQGVRASDLERNRSFLSRLDDALKQQEKNIVRAESAVELMLDNWRHMHLKKSAMDDYQERCVQEEKNQANKRDQKVNDELVSQRFNKKPF